LRDGKTRVVLKLRRMGPIEPNVDGTHTSYIIDICDET